MKKLWLKTGMLFISKTKISKDAEVLECNFKFMKIDDWIFSPTTLWCRKRIMCRKRVMAPHLGLCIVPKESHGCPGLHNKSSFSKTNNHLFSLQNCRLILIRVMVEYLVKVLILMRVMCGTRVMLLCFGTREYLLSTQQRKYSKCLV